MMDYDDDYPTCLETFASVRVWSGDLTVSEVSTILGTSPTWSVAKGDLRSERTSPNRRHYDEHGWSFSTQELSDSRDCRRHLDILIDRVLSDGAAIQNLKSKGCKVDVVVFYSYTQGGPTISPVQMTALAKAGVDVWWDLYR